MNNKVYDIITEKVIEKLEEGTVPWHRPWIGGEMPMNLVSKKPYRGINVFMLSCTSFVSPYWLSYKQAKKLGGNVKKGEKSTIVVFWKPIEVDDKDSEEDGKKKTIRLLRYYRVFNVEQCENIDEKKIPKLDTRDDFQSLDKCESIINDMQNKPSIKFEQQQAFYHPLNDFVNMPKQNTFNSDEEYYSTFFHELTHSTGHKTRLGRHQKEKCNHIFGSKDYSKEELVAEMGAAFLCGLCGIENKTIDNSAAYIKGWLKKLKDDVKMVVLTAAQAQKAADYILNVKY
jgi:antirestriction protein ArdC